MIYFIIKGTLCVTNIFFIFVLNILTRQMITVMSKIINIIYFKME